MQLVLWPKYLLGGLLQRESGLGGAERGDGAAAGFSDGFRGMAARATDGETLLQGAMSDELRDWDLWSVSRAGRLALWLTKVRKGAFALLHSPQPPALLLRRQAAARERVHGRLWDRLARLAGRDPADSTAGREDVSEPCRLSFRPG